MAPTRRHVLALTATSFSLAGCLGGGSSGDGAAEDDPATVQVRNHEEFGEILVDADGMTLYRFDQDTQGNSQSACSGGCTDAWPPFSVSVEPTAGEQVTATLSTFERGDGVTQVAADGWPLYYYASDSAPGDVEGQGANDVWWVVGPDGSKITEAAESTGRSY